MAPPPPGYVSAGYHLVRAVLDVGSSDCRAGGDGGGSDAAASDAAPSRSRADVALLRAALPAQVEVIKRGTGGERAAGDLAVFVTVVEGGATVVYEVRLERGDARGTTRIPPRSIPFPSRRSEN